MTKRQNKNIFFARAYILGNFFLLMLIFTYSFKRKTHKMGKMKIDERARAVRMLVIVSMKGCTHFKSAVYFVF